MKRLLVLTLLCSAPIGMASVGPGSLWKNDPVDQNIKDYFKIYFVEGKEKYFAQEMRESISKALYAIPELNGDRANYNTKINDLMRQFAVNVMHIERTPHGDKGRNKAIDIINKNIDAHNKEVDKNKREIKKEKISLDIIRIGTSGTIRSEIEIDQIILSKGAIGLDGLMHFYERETDQCEDELLNWDIPWPIKPYMTWGSKKLLDQFSKLGEQAITISSTGFYGPQNRMIRLKPKVSNFFELLDNQIIDGSRIANLEMETSGLYGLSEILGHECISINAIIANRALGVFSKDPAKTVKRTIESALGLI